MDSVVLLGYVVIYKGVEVYEEKIKVIDEWPKPKSVTQFRSFHSFVRYDRRLIKDFGTVTTPLNKVIKKENVFTWRTKQYASFNLLKEKLFSSPFFGIT